MVEGPRRVNRKKESHLECVAKITSLRSGQKVLVWEDFPSDSQKPMWLTKGEIGTITNVDGDGDALINFAGKDSGGRSLSTIVKRSKYTMLRVEVPGKQRLGRPGGEEPGAKRRATAAAAAAPQGGEASLAASSSAPVEKVQPAAALAAAKAAAAAAAAEEAKPLTEEERGKREAAAAWLKKEPKKGVVRYTFKEDIPLGLRFSKDVPPWILEVKDGSPAARKAPRVPVAGIVMAVNGYEITEKDSQVMEGLKKRPVVLDVDWPVDQEFPIVNRA